MKTHLPNRLPLANAGHAILMASRYVSTWLIVVASIHSLAAEPSGVPVQASDLFQLTKVWTLHLLFTKEQWEAMEPVQEQTMRGGPGFDNPGHPGGAGPAMFLVPAFLKADKDNDGKLSKAEFLGLADKWFSEWDSSKAGQVGEDQLRDGMNATFAGNLAGGNAGPPGPPLLGENGHRNGLASAAGIDFKYVHADLEFEGHSYRDVAVRYKGNGTFMESRGSIKRSLKIDLNKYVKGQKIAGQTKLNLHNNVTDASWMNEVLSYRAFRDANVPASRTAYAKVYVTVPGQYDRKYFGLYSLVEEVDTHFAQDRFGSREGVLFKPVTSTLFGYLGEDWSDYTQMYDPKTDLSRSDKQRVIDFSKLVTKGSDAEFSARLAEFLDLDEFARFMSATVWLSTLDSILMMGQNFYLYLHPQTHKFQFLPWDLDHSFGQFPMGGTQEQREQLSIVKPWRGSNRFLERVFNSEPFKTLYLASMKQLAKTVFVPERLSKQVDDVGAAIRPAVAEESELKLQRFDTVVAGKSVERLGFGGPMGARQGEGPEPRRFGPGGFMGSAKPIKAFVVARSQSVNDQLAGQSKGETLVELGFGPGQGRFHPGADGPGRFGPGMFLSHTIMDSFDTNKDGKLSHEEFSAGFAKWFDEWNRDKTGFLTQEQLRGGIDRTLAPLHDGPPGGFGFGPPEDGPAEGR